MFILKSNLFSFFAASFNFLINHKRKKGRKEGKRKEGRRKEGKQVGRKKGSRRQNWRLLDKEDEWERNIMSE